MSLNIHEIQERIYKNKITHGFNVTDIPLEFSLTYGELAEAFDAYTKKTGTVGEEFADVIIFILGMCKILEIDIETELFAKMEKNESRTYINKDGVFIKTDNK